MSRPSANEYDTNSNTFKVSPNLVLGNLYKQYQETMHLHALSTPKEYSLVRMKAIQNIKMHVIADLYENLRGVLCEGKLGKDHIVNLGGKNLVPNYPPAAADDIILSIAKALDREIDDIVDIVVPPNRGQLDQKLESRGVSDIN